MQPKPTFNIRVYGLFINDRNEILLADEERFGTRMTKFPGGGLLYGEGTIDCLKREVREEIGQEIEVIAHFYTTDYFQPAYFHENQQLISIYYRARFRETESFRIATKAFDFTGFETNEKISFRYIPLRDLRPAHLTLPVDKHVTDLLK